MRWLRKNGEIIGCEIDGMEYNLIAVVKNETLHALYHKELKEGTNEGTDTGDGSK
jgi:hypothetical protein